MLSRNPVGRRLNLFGLPFKPILLWGAISMAIMAQANLRNVDRGLNFPLSTIVAFLAATNLCLVIAAAVARSSMLVQVSLLGMFLAFTTRTVFIWIQSPWEQAGWYGVAAMVLVGGAYFVERSDHLRRRAGE